MASSSINHLHNMSLAFFLVILLGGFLASQARLLEDQPSMREMHEQWMTRFGRVYKDLEEKESRFKIFEKNVERINAFNTGGGSEARSYKQGVNQFADMSDEDIRAFGNCNSRRELVPPTTTNRRSSLSSSSSSDDAAASIANSSVLVGAIPLSVDWTELGAVTPVKNIGLLCGGSSWAFSVAAAVEGVHQIKTGKLVSLSAQQILDCDTHSNGCLGGTLANAYNLIKNNGGIASEADYPYVGLVGGGTCKTGKQPAASIAGYVTLPKYDQEKMRTAVASQPITVDIAVTSSDFMSYTGGVYEELQCPTDISLLKHSVTVVGYGTDADGKDYWKIKNSWGATWGESGYVRMDARRYKEDCGIIEDASFPIGS